MLLPQIFRALLSKGTQKLWNKLLHHHVVTQTKYIFKSLLAYLVFHLITYHHLRRWKLLFWPLNYSKQYWLYTGCVHLCRASSGCQSVSGHWHDVCLYFSLLPHKLCPDKLLHATTERLYSVPRSLLINDPVNRSNKIQTRKEKKSQVVLLEQPKRHP